MWDVLVNAQLRNDIHRWLEKPHYPISHGGWTFDALWAGLQNTFGTPERVSVSVILCQPLEYFQRAVCLNPEASLLRRRRWRRRF